MNGQASTSQARNSQASTNQAGATQAVGDPTASLVDFPGRAELEELLRSILPEGWESALRSGDDDGVQLLRSGLHRRTVVAEIGAGRLGGAALRPRTRWPWAFGVRCPCRPHTFGHLGRSAHPERLRVGACRTDNPAMGL